jgi:cell division transport system permease protein
MAQKKSFKISTFGSQATSVVSVALTLLILGVLGLTLLAARSLTDAVSQNVAATVKVSPEVSDVALNKLKQQFAKAPYLVSYTYTSADQVLAQEVQYIGEEVTTLLDENPYSAEFELHFKKKYTNTDSINAITARLQKNEAIDSVITDTTVVENVNRSLSKLTIVLLVIAAALLLISFVLINNTVSLAIYSRRFIIHTMKLVGATPGFIRRPFVNAGIVNGLISGIIASIVLACAQTYAVNLDADIAATLSWESSIVVYVGIIIIGMLVCAFASFWATSRYLRRNYDSLYRK